MKFFQGRRNKISRNPKPKLDAAAVATELSNAVKRPKSGKKKNTILPGDKPCLDSLSLSASVTRLWRSVITSKPVYLSAPSTDRASSPPLAIAHSRRDWGSGCRVADETNLKYRNERSADFRIVERNAPAINGARGIPRRRNFSSPLFKY
jgi:hypothetical protein